MVAKKNDGFPTRLERSNNYLQLSTITVYNYLQLPYNNNTINGWAQAFRVTGAFMGLVPLPDVHYLPQCYRQKSDVTEVVPPPPDHAC